MFYRTVKKSGDRLSNLGFGCMRLPTKDGNIDEERATRQIRHAIDSGVNYIDTAWPYHAGESETLVGRALADGYRERVKLSTKLPTWMIRNREDMDQYLNAQLQRLNTEQIDYYHVHSLNGFLWSKASELGVIDFLDKAKADGRIVNAGFSFHGQREDFKRIVDAYPWEFCLIQYNYLDEESQAGTEGLMYAASKDMGVMVMEPLRGGTLGLSEPPPAVDALWKEAKQQRSPAEWALRWVWNHPEVTLVLSGMNEEAHIEENLAVAGHAIPNSLTEDELQLVSQVGRKYREIMEVNCTGCGYCLPCSMDVDIPGCFELFNNLHMFGAASGAGFLYAVRAGGLVSGKSGYASQCAQCGDCLEKCPQNLEIPDVLERVVAAFEGPDLKERVVVAKRMLKIS